MQECILIYLAYKVSYGSAQVSFIHFTRPQIIEQRFTLRGNIGSSVWD